MNTIKHLSKHFNDVFTGGNWTCSNLKDQLADITWQQATTQVFGLNTIATLTYHIHYYVHAAIGVLEGHPLTSKDEQSFDHPPIHSQADWMAFLEKVWADVDALTKLMAELPESKLWEDFTDVKYGTYYRNLAGIIEHTHYHLGQIALLKKILKLI